jgi:hypothetical protein
MPTPDQTLSKFLRVLDDPGPGHAHYQDVNYLVDNLFCHDNAMDRTPSVGLIDHNGPQFLGAQEVKGLFRQLFNTFPDFRLTPLVWASRYYSPDGKGIVIQAQLFGTFQSNWFQRPSPHYSPPLSDLAPGRNRSTDLPACAVFSFDDDGRIVNLAIYFDRDRMARELR